MSRDVTGLPVVFLGPTMPRADAERLLPGRYPGPAGCGDVLAALRLDPNVILLIDGVFERQAAVWHKEILFAMESGVPVVGAASMGALRASELEPFGMVGVGDIFRNFVDGTVVDDDEVAVAHGDRSDGFRPLSTAMVDIRASLARAVSEIGLAPEAAKLAAEEAKQIFYPQRSLPAAVMSARRVMVDADWDGLLEFVRVDNYSQKRTDAEEALSEVSSGEALVASRDQRVQPTETRRSVFFRKLCLEVAATPLRFEESCLSEREIHVRGFATDRVDRVLISHLARLLAVVESISRLEGWDYEDVEAVSSGADFVIPGGAANAALNAVALDQAIQRVESVRRLESVVGPTASIPWPVALHSVMRVHGVYASLPPASRTTNAELLASIGDRRFRLFRHVAKLWSVLDTVSRRNGVERHRQTSEQSIQTFRADLGLDDDRLDDWLIDNDLDWDGLVELADFSSRILFLIDNPQLLGTVDQRLDVAWISDAVALSETDRAPGGSSTAAASTPRWDGVQALNSAYEFLHAEIIPDDPDILHRMAQGPAADRAAREVYELMLDVNEHVYCAGIDARRNAVIEDEVRGRVLDHGCGAGFNALALADRGHRVTAVDSNEVKLRFINWVAKRRGSVDRIDHVWSGSYDTVVSINVIDHLPDASSLIGEFAESLSADGMLLLDAHFSADGVHTSDPGVITAVFSELARRFDRATFQPGLDVEVWLRPHVDSASRPGPLRVPGDAPMSQLVPVRHPEISRRRQEESVVVSGRRWYLRPTRLSRVAGRILDQCDGTKSVAQISVAAEKDSIDAKTVEQVIGDLWSQRLVWMLSRVSS